MQLITLWDLETNTALPSRMELPDKSVLEWKQARFDLAELSIVLAGGKRVESAQELGLMIRRSLKSRGLVKPWDNLFCGGRPGWAGVNSNWYPVPSQSQELSQVVLDVTTKLMGSPRSRMDGCLVLKARRAALISRNAWAKVPWGAVVVDLAV